MRSTLAISALLLTLGLSGCAPAPIVKEPGMAPLANIPPNTLPCKVNEDIVGDCVIELTVRDGSGPKDCTIVAKVTDSDLITLKNREAKDKLLYWRIIDSPGYRFTRDGIAFIDNFRPRNFTEGERLNEDNDGFQWRFVGNARRVNGYIINVRNPTNGRECDKDPWVRNR
jgi:hypothetical protein